MDRRLGAVDPTGELLQPDTFWVLGELGEHGEDPVGPDQGTRWRWLAPGATGGVIRHVPNSRPIVR